MKTNSHRRFGLRLAGAVAALSVLSAGLLLACGTDAVLRGDLLDSRVSCDKLGPKGCEPSVAAVPRQSANA